MSYIQAHKKVIGSFQILVFVFKLEYFCQFSAKYKNQEQF